MNRLLLSSLIAGTFALSPLAQSASSIPSSHMLNGVIWHQQMNGLFCGPGSLEIVFDYWGPDIDQKEIVDVARTSSIGTWCWDIQRAGHFSVLSAAQGSYFQSVQPTAGFPERPLGYAAFAHAADAMWLDDLKGLIAADIPVVILMKFAPDGSGGVHYRVAIGYDDNLGVIFFSDPWGRDMDYLPGMEGVTAWTYAEVAAGWNYVGYGTTQPFWGAAIMPWKVNVATKDKVKVGTTITVTAQVSYPCPRPFDPSQFPASAAQAFIEVPAGMVVVGQPVVNLGNLAAGASGTATWQVRVDAAPAAGAAITVTASGLVSGSVPASPWEGVSQSYPPYSYTDLIGGTGQLAF